MSIWSFLGVKLLVALIVFLLVWKGADLSRRLRGEP